jgi:hypothetical protein
MKIVKNFGIAIIALGMVTSCEKSSNEINPDFSIDQLQSSQSPEESFRSAEKPEWGSSDVPGSKIVTVPFKSNFYTKQDGPMDTSCGSSGMFLNNQMGEGNATHLGEFTTTMVFCYNLNPQGPDPDSDYPDTPYWEYTGGSGSFVAANGDELYFEMAGRVYILYFNPDDLENTDLRWDDPFIFTGGTGRFDGASGGGTTNSYTDDGIVNNHNWMGTLILPKGSN